MPGPHCRLGRVPSRRARKQRLDQRFDYTLLLGYGRERLRSEAAQWLSRGLSKRPRSYRDWPRRLERSTSFSNRRPMSFSRRSRSASPQSLEAKIVFSEPIVFVAPTLSGPTRDALSRRRIDWSKVPLLLPAEGLVRAAVDDFFRRRRIQRRVIDEVSGNEALLMLVAMGVGVGVLPYLVYASSPLRSVLEVVSVKPELTPLQVGFCTRRRKPGDDGDSCVLDNDSGTGVGGFSA